MGPGQSHGGGQEGKAPASFEVPASEPTLIGERFLWRG